MTPNTVVLRDWLRRRRGVDLADYEALRRWSVEQVADFWQAMWDYFDLHSPTPYVAVLADSRMPGARWFEGAQINFTQQVLRHVAAGDAARVPAIVFRNERRQREGTSVTLSWPVLADQVGALAATLRALGVQRGDRVAAYLPNIPQAAVAFLACASLGAIWSLTAPDMGVATVCDRFRQIEPKVLIAADGTVYGGKVFDRRDAVAQMLQRLPSVQAVLRVPYLDDAGAAGAPLPMALTGFGGRIVDWAEALAATDRVAPEPVPFDHPLWIVYSSGTTGLPKPIVHGHGGGVLEHLKLQAFHLDLRPSAERRPDGGYVDSGERFCWYSSTGWVMWNAAICVLLNGVTTCLYDGHPSSPDAGTLWRFAADLKLSFLGAGAAYFSACLKAGYSPRRAVDLGRLRTLGATGSPLPPEAMVWGFEEVRPDVWWAVISGGTDFASAFLGGTPELPSVPGRMQARCLGADVQAWDEAGRPLIDAVGELVCTQPLPSMPLCFWGDADGRRYRDAYFDMYPGVWRHGDWLEIGADGGAIIHGRSDATLNRHGHRMGTAELYQVVEALPQVVDSLVVDIEVLGRPPFMPLFVVLRPGLRLDTALEAEIRQRIRDGLSPRFLPDEIVQVAEVPRTLTGKKQELPVKKLLLGRPLADVVNKDACANPASFDTFVDYARRQLPPTGGPAEWPVAPPQG